MISTEAAASRQGPCRSPITVRLWHQDGGVTIEVSDAGPGLTLFSGSRPLGTCGRGFPAAAAIAQEMGVHSGACKATVWARLHFRWVSAETEPGALSACAFLRERQRAYRARKARPWQAGPWLARYWEMLHQALDAPAGGVRTD